MWFHKTFALILISLVLRPSLGVEPRNPQSKDGTLTAGISEIKTILSSVQGSLITSVSLIQGNYALSQITLHLHCILKLNKGYPQPLGI